MSDRSDQNILQKKFVVPVQTTDLTLFDDAFFTMKEHFVAEMKRMDQEMTKFSKDLMCLYGQASSAQSGVTSAQRDPRAGTLESITNSPLIEGEGETKTLKLQFDVSQFEPSEVIVKIMNEVLIVTAMHEEKADNFNAYREYHKEFLLPKGINPEEVLSSLSKDGVLTVQMPLPNEALTIVEQTLSKERAPSKEKAPK